MWEGYPQNNHPPPRTSQAKMHIYTQSYLNEVVGEETDGSKASRRVAGGLIYMLRQFPVAGADMHNSSVLLTAGEFY